MSDAVEVAARMMFNEVCAGESILDLNQMWSDDGLRQRWIRATEKACQHLAAADKARAVTDEEVLAVLDLSNGLGSAVLSDLHAAGMKVVRA